MTEAHVQRSAELPIDTAAALEMLTDPDLVSEWLGPWERSDGAGSDPRLHAVVTTDDGVRRAVRDLEVRHDGVRWSWAPAGRPDERSDVVIVVEAVAPERTRLTVHEVRARALDPAGQPEAGVALDGIKWSICLLVLEIAAAGALRRAGAGV